MITVTHIGNLPYITGLRLPIHWRDEQSGLVPAAVKAFINHQADPDQDPAPTAEQLSILVDYLHYYIHAPCWEFDSTDDSLPALRDGISRLKESDQLTPDAVDRWLWQCMDTGIDPL